MSDFLPPRDWTPENDGDEDRIEVLRQALLSQYDHLARIANGCAKLAERQNEIATTFADACLVLAQHVEKQEEELKSLRLIVRMLVAQTP